MELKEVFNIECKNVYRYCKLKYFVIWSNCTTLQALWTKLNILCDISLKFVQWCRYRFWPQTSDKQFLCMYVKTYLYKILLFTFVH